MSKSNARKVSARKPKQAQKIVECLDNLNPIIEAAASRIAPLVESREQTFIDVGGIVSEAVANYCDGKEPTRKKLYGGKVVSALSKHKDVDLDRSWLYHAWKSYRLMTENGEELKSLSLSASVKVELSRLVDKSSKATILRFARNANEEKLSARAVRKLVKAALEPVPAPDKVKAVSAEIHSIAERFRSLSEDIPATVTEQESEKLANDVAGLLSRVPLILARLRLSQIQKETLVENLKMIGDKISSGDIMGTTVRHQSREAVGDVEPEPQLTIK